MFSVRISLNDLQVDPALLYSGSRGAKYAHVQRLLILNKSALMLLHPLEQFGLEPTAEHIDMVGSRETLQAALLDIRRVLSKPVWVSAPEDPKLLEVLQAKKKRFSTVCKCWLKCDWTTNQVMVYGLNRPVAIEFIDRVRTMLAQKPEPAEQQPQPQVQPQPKVQQVQQEIQEQFQDATQKMYELDTNPQVLHLQSLSYLQPPAVGEYGSNQLLASLQRSPTADNSSKNGRSRSGSSSSETALSNVSDMCHTPGYETNTERTHSDSNISPRQDDPTVQIAMEVLSSPENIDWILSLLAQISKNQVDLRQLADFLDLQRTMLEFL
jgi:hypothetical protein